MIRRLYIVMVHALAVLLLTSSFTGAVVASHWKPASEPVINHQDMAHAQHDHEQSMASERSKKECLAFCFEGLSDHYQGSSPVAFPYPELVESSADPLFALVSQIYLAPSQWINSARGPPGYSSAKTVNGLSGVLLLNGRMRN